MIMSMMESCRIFLLSPANAVGKRADLLLSSDNFELAKRFQTQGAPIGEVFSFLSGLYFRGKLSYAERFARRSSTGTGVYIITSNRGLLTPDITLTGQDLLAYREVPIDDREPKFTEPLIRSASALAESLPGSAEIVLLGSIGTRKYTGPLLPVFGAQLFFPAAFVGRGDMSRGGLLLRCIDDGCELEYLPIDGATVHGTRPPKLKKRTPA
jgi:hypothetical protein